MVSNASIGSDFSNRIFKRSCVRFFVCVGGLVGLGFFLPTLIYVSFPVQQWYKSQWEPFWCLCWDITIHTCGLCACIWRFLAKGNWKPLCSPLGALWCVMLLVERKGRDWVPLVWFWPVVFLLFSEGIQHVFLLIRCENKILLDLIHKKS